MSLTLLPTILTMLTFMHPIETSPIPEKTPIEYSPVDLMVLNDRIMAGSRKTDLQKSIDRVIYRLLLPLNLD